MFSNYLAIPSVLLSLLFLYLAWEVDSEYSIWIAPCVVLSAVIYIFSPQINWWWYNRRPPRLEPGLISLLERFCGFYRRLSPGEKERFRGRVALFRMGTDWEPMAFEEEAVPADVQLVLAAQAVMLAFGRPALLFDKFEKVIVYPRPFSTPEYPFDHASELFEPDGCVLFSAEQLMRAFAEPSNWYNVGLHEYAKVYALTYPGEPYPNFEAEDVWEKLQTVSQMPRGHVESVVGIAGVDALPVAIHHYFVFPERFREVFPEEAKVFDGIFGSRPKV